MSPQSQPSPTNPRSTSPESPSMTETQPLPRGYPLPPPPFFTNPGPYTPPIMPRLPPPVHVSPSSSISSPSFPFPSTTRSPIAQSSSSYLSRPDIRPPTTSISSLLSGQPYPSTPPRSQYQPAYPSAIEPRGESAVPSPSSYHSRRSPHEDSRLNTALLPSPTSHTRKRPFDEILHEEPQYSPSRPMASSQSSLSIGPEPVAPISPGRFDIRVRQQPAAARACGFGERDRRVIDPPPIVQLTIRDPRADSSELRYPFHVVHCSLWSQDGSTDETTLKGTDKRMTRRLMGTLVSSPFVGVDENGEEGCFFCFPDLSCRTHGKFKLKFVLMRIDYGNGLNEGEPMPIVASAMSETFTVYTAKEFPGMRPSTALTKALKRQGCAISVKKGNEKASATAKSDDDDDHPSTPTGRATKKRRGGGQGAG